MTPVTLARLEYGLGARWPRARLHGSPVAV